MVESRGSQIYACACMRDVYTIQQLKGWYRERFVHCAKPTCMLKCLVNSLAACFSVTNTTFSRVTGSMNGLTRDQMALKRAGARYRNSLSSLEQKQSKWLCSHGLASGSQNPISACLSQLNHDASYCQPSMYHFCRRRVMFDLPVWTTGTFCSSLCRPLHPRTR